MKKTSIFVLAIMSAVLAFTPNWKNQLHAQAGEYQLNSNFKGSTVKDDQSAQ